MKNFRASKPRLPDCPSGITVFQKVLPRRQGLKAGIVFPALNDRSLKRLLLLAMLFFAHISLKAQIINSGLIAYYPFNNNATDQSGFSHNGTVNGATLTTDRNGAANSAYLFNGTSNYIEVTDQFLRLRRSASHSGPKQTLLAAQSALCWFPTLSVTV
jgi:hypothetical protein